MYILQTKLMCIVDFNNVVGQTNVGMHTNVFANQSNITVDVIRSVYIHNFKQLLQFYW